MNTDFESEQLRQPHVDVGVVGFKSSAAMARAVVSVAERGVLVVDDSQMKPFRPGMMGMAMLAAMGGMGFMELDHKYPLRELNQHDLDCLQRAEIKRERKAKWKSFHTD